MPGKRPFTIAGRFDEKELGLVDHARSIIGLNRSDYVRATMLPQAEADIRAELDKGSPSTK